jgi:hypothetical protein
MLSRMRKKSMLTSVLLALVIMGTAANLLVFFRYLQVLNVAQRLQMQAQRLQAAAAQVNRNVTVARSVATESIEFGRKNPAMENLLKPFTPLLQRLELVPAPAAR